MTKKQRSQVVELLRCAADMYRVGVGGLMGGIGVARSFLDVSEAVWLLAVRAWNDVADVCDLRGQTYSDVCLEAAQRVEDGSWEP